MDAYTLVLPGCDLTVLPALMGEDIEVTGPDYANGWHLEGAESVVLAAIEHLRNLQVLRMFIIL